jgi:serine/threonine protein kinase
MAHAVDHGHDDNSTSILGTAQYMAPEQILVEPVDERTDVYGLGVVLFRAVTGHLPFDDVKNKHHLLRHQLFSPVPPASWLREDLSLPLERLIHRSTRKAPAARFANMQEMVAAFDRALEAEDVCQNELDDPAIAEDAAELALGLELQVPVDPDVYVPLSSKGQRAAEVLAIEFGIYSRPQRTWSMESRAVESRSANHGGLESRPVDSRSVDSRSVDSSG